MKSLQMELVEKGVSDACAGEVEQINTKAKVKSKEQLSDWEWREMMGKIDRPING